MQMTFCFAFRDTGSLIRSLIFEATSKLGMVAHVCNSSTQKEEEENPELKAILGYTGTSRSAWATLASKQNESCQLVIGNEMLFK